MTCQHSPRGYYRLPFRVGSGYHVAELCRDCGANVRGPGVWVSRREIVGDPDQLPVAPARSKDRQASLFDAGCGGEGECD